LVQQAVDALLAATQAKADENVVVIEERAIYRPDSWLIQRCWEVLADAGAAEPALVAARLAATRQPLAIVQCLHRLSRQIDRHWGLASAVTRELVRLQGSLFAEPATPPTVYDGERLLYAAAAAANLDDRTLAFACLERLDQLPQPWDRFVVQPDQRSLLADTIVRTGLHPLTAALVTSALRRFSDAGAHLVLDITSGAADRLRRSPSAAKMARLLGLGVDTFRNASLTSLHSRRVTATVFGQAGMVDEVLAQLTTIANIQLARKESGLSLRQGDPQLLRQVKRPTANADVDFQVYTLREAIRALPLRQVSRDARVELANRLATLGAQSDGWTAAGAATTLVELGAIKFAVDVINQIPPKDATRAEGVISLVRALLVAGEPGLAEEQMQTGLAWARAYPGRNPERALIWGLSDVYLERKQSDQALALLDQWELPSSFRQRLRSLFGRKIDDDELRNTGLRLRALLQRERTASAEIERLVALLTQAAPRLLDGEALINFLVGDMLKPLLVSGRTRLALSLLPTLQRALRTGSGEKHATRVAAVANALAAELAPARPETLDPAAGNGRFSPEITPETRDALVQFVVGLWQDDAKRGLWQTVHGVEGSLPLVLFLDGPAAVASIAQSVAGLSSQWAT